MSLAAPGITRGTCSRGPQEVSASNARRPVVASEQHRPSDLSDPTLRGHVVKHVFLGLISRMGFQVGQENFCDPVGLFRTLSNLLQRKDRTQPNIDSFGALLH